MSTRSAIGVFTDPHNTAWHARYCHFDGYPSGVGQTLINEYQRAFAPDLSRLIAKLMAEKVGWSALDSRDLALPSGWSAPSLDDNAPDAARNPLSYTVRGETPHNPDDGDYIESDGDTWSTEYAYIFDVPRAMLYVYSHRGVWVRIGLIAVSDLGVSWDTLDDQGRYNSPLVTLPSDTDWLG